MSSACPRVSPTAVGNSVVIADPCPGRGRPAAWFFWRSLLPDERGCPEGAAGQDDSVGDLAAECDHLGEHRRHIDRDHRAPRREPQIEAVDAHALPGVLHPAVAQQLSDDLDAFPDPRQRPRIGDAVLPFDLHLVARTDPENKPAGREVIERGGGHRDRWDRTHKDTGDAGPEQDPRGLGGAGGQHRELVAAMPFGDPRRFVSERLGKFHAFHDLGGVGSAGERDPEPLHPLPPAVRSE